MLQHTVKLDEIQQPDFYDCIFVPGGHGPMYDLAQSQLLGDILTKAAAAGESVREGSICSSRLMASFQMTCGVLALFQLLLL